MDSNPLTHTAQRLNKTKRNVLKRKKTHPRTQKTFPGSLLPEESAKPQFSALTWILMTDGWALGCWPAGPWAGPLPKHHWELGDSCHVPLPADSTVPQAHRPPSHLPPFSTVKPKATIVNKCGLSPKTDEETEGYNMSLLDRGWGRVSTVTPQACANLW